jgi:hypothetical protein
MKMSSIILEEVIKTEDYSRILKEANDYILTGENIIYKLKCTVEDPFLFIKLGFTPTNFSEYFDNIPVPFGFMDKHNLSFNNLLLNEYIEEIINNTDKNTVKFWYGVNIFKFFNFINIWEYKSIELHKKDGLLNGYSLFLARFTPELLYNSKRVKTDMSIFRSSSSLFENNLKLNEIPVTRYANNKIGGMFYNPERLNLRKQFKGTFYYLEEESNVFLLYINSVTYKNKYEAYIDLKRHVQLNDENLSQDLVNEMRIINEFMKSKNLGNRILRGEILCKENLMYTPLEIISFLDENNIKMKDKFFYLDEYDYRMDDFSENIILEFDQERYDDLIEQLEEDENIDEYDKKDYSNEKFVFYNYDRELLSSIPNIPRFCGKWLGIYAIEDVFDQILCYLCKKLNIDILIFEKSVGSHGFVSEILDSRERNDSFENLCFK